MKKRKGGAASVMVHTRASLIWSDAISIRRSAEMILDRSRFSSGFHKEGISSTVFAQAWAVFLLQAAGFWLRVGAAKT
jgi:hypothetical protein